MGLLTAAQLRTLTMLTHTQSLNSTKGYEILLAQLTMIVGQTGQIDPQTSLFKKLAISPWIDQTSLSM